MAVLALLLGLAGCGLGPGPSRGGSAVQLRVTRDFGQRTLATARLAKVRPSDTVMRFLQAHTKTTTRYGGGFVQSIDGLAGSSSAGHRDWFYFVNGVEAPTGAANRTLSPGDVVQWDYRRWDATQHVPAIVGAFPEPFLHGQEGTRYPTRVECASAAGSACDRVQNALERAGVPTGTGSLGSEARGGLLRVEVGKWADLRDLQDLDTLEKGVAASGVYARFDSASHLYLMDADGHVARTAPPGTGLIAAIIPPDQQPLWVVTGVDDAGVKRAAALLSPARLRNAYAVAALPSGPVRLPIGGGR